MIFTPTNTIPGNFDAVSSEEIQNMIKKDIDPIPGAARTGRYSIIFSFEGEKADIEWKYASASDRNTDYDAIIAAANAGGGGAIAPTTLQAVTDNGAETTNQVTFNDPLLYRTFAGASGLSGENGAEGAAVTTWTIDSEGGTAEFVELYDRNGIVTSTQVIITVLPAAVLTLGTVGAQLVSGQGADRYFTEMDIALEYIPGTIAYDLGLGTILSVSYDGGSYIAKADAFALSDTVEAAWMLKISPTYEITDNPVFGNVEFNSAVVLKLQDASGGDVDPTLGDGSLRAVVTYKYRAFGV